MAVYTNPIKIGGIAEEAELEDEVETKAAIVPAIPAINSAPVESAIKPPKIRK